MSFFSKIFSPLKAVVDRLLGKIKDPAFRAGVEQAAVEVIGFADMARPIVEALAKATPTQYDDMLVRGAQLIGYEAKAILAMSAERRGDYLRDIARELLREKLLKQVLNGSTDIVINGMKILSGEQVSKLGNSALNKIIEFAYDALKKSLSQ